MIENFYEIKKPSSTKKSSQPLFLESIHEDITLLKNQSEILEKQIIKLVDNAKVVKKQVKRICETMKQQIKQDIKQKEKSLGQVLILLDNKIQFVIDNCQKYSRKILKTFNALIQKKSQENDLQEQFRKKQEIQQDKLNYLISRLQILQKKVLTLKTQQNQLKSKYELLKQRNSQLLKQYNILSIEFNKQTNELQTIIKMKNEELKDKDFEISEYILKIQKMQKAQKRIVKTFQKNQIPNSPPLNDILFPPQNIKSQNNEKTFLTSYTNDQNNIQLLSPIQLNSKFSIKNNDSSHNNNNISSKQIILKDNRMNSFEEFFTKNLADIKNIKNNTIDKQHHAEKLVQQQSNEQIMIKNQNIFSQAKRKIQNKKQENNGNKQFTKQEIQRFDNLLLKHLTPKNQNNISKLNQA